MQLLRSDRNDLYRSLSDRQAAVVLSIYARLPNQTLSGLNLHENVG